MDRLIAATSVLAKRGRDPGRLQGMMDGKQVAVLAPTTSWHNSISNFPATNVGLPDPIEMLAAFGRRPAEESPTICAKVGSTSSSGRTVSFR